MGLSYQLLALSALFVSFSHYLWHQKNKIQTDFVEIFLKSLVLFISGLSSAIGLTYLCSQKLGASVYPGIIGALLSFALLQKIQNKRFYEEFDLAGPSAFLGLGLSRLACFFEGCCPGRIRIVNFSLFENSTVFFEFVLITSLAFAWKTALNKQLIKTAKIRFWFFLLLYGTVRIVLDLARDEKLYLPYFEPLSLNLTLCLATFSCGLILWLSFRLKQKKIGFH